MPECVLRDLLGRGCHGNGGGGDGYVWELVNGLCKRGFR